jgi:O-antigen/teichoic acid export membrane protein
LIERLSRLGWRFAIMLSGEGLQSALAFGLNIALARTISERRYGEFAIIVLTSGLATIYMRTLFGVAACTFVPMCRRESAARAYAVSFGSGAVAFACGCAVFSAAAFALFGLSCDIAAGAFVGMSALRSYVRLAFFAQRRAVLATAGDLVFVVVATSLCVPLILQGDTLNVLQNVFLALTAAHGAGIAVALLLLRQPVRLSLRKSVRLRFSKLLVSLSWSIASVTSATIQSQGPTLLIATLAGPAAYAPIAAMTSILSPLRLAAIALANMTQPEIARTLSGRDSRKMLPLLITISLIILVTCVAYAVALAVAFPFLRDHLFAGRFAGASLYLITLELSCIATTAMLAAPAKILLEATRDFKQTAIASIIGAAVGLPLVAFLLVTRSVALSMLGLLASELVVLIGCWIAAVVALRGRRIDPIATPVG